MKNATDLDHENNILNSDTRQNTKSQLRDKMALAFEAIRQNLSEVDRIQYRDEVNLQQVKKNYPHLVQLVNGIYAINWYLHYLDSCSNEVDFPQIGKN